MENTIEDGVCSNENKDKNKNEQREKRPWEDWGYDDPPFYDEFWPIWGPGSKYKPWIYGK